MPAVRARIRGVVDSVRFLRRVGAPVVPRGLFSGALGPGWVLAPRPRPLVFGSATVPSLPAVLRASAGRLAFDPGVDGRLAGTPVPVRRTASAYTLPEGLRRVAPYVVWAAARRNQPFNGPNVRLRTDVDGDLLDRGSPAVVQRSDYFSFLCSNELTGSDLQARDGAFPFREDHLFDAAGDFRRLDSSELNNCLGASTLAITTDDRLVVTVQGARSQGSAGRPAPSGSGAVEPQDYPASGVLQDFVCRGAERELREETGIPREAVGRSAVIGYGRWLDRGGLPEFFCVTALTVSSAELVRRGLVGTVPVAERSWVQEVSLVPLDLGAVRTLPASLPTSGERAPCWQGAGLVDLSRWPGEPAVPLDAALDALARTLQADPGFLSRLRDRAV